MGRKRNIPYHRYPEPKPLHPVFYQVRALRIEQGLTQAELGERSGYSLDVVFKMETGKNLPRIKTFLDLCDFLNVDIKLVPREENVQPDYQGSTHSTDRTRANDDGACSDHWLRSASY